MRSAPPQVYDEPPEPRPDTLADVRDAMNRRGDFDPDPTDYSQDSSHFEVLAALEALTVEGEVLA